MFDVPACNMAAYRSAVPGLSSQRSTSSLRGGCFYRLAGLGFDLGFGVWGIRAGVVRWQDGELYKAQDLAALEPCCVRLLGRYETMPGCAWGFGLRLCFGLPPQAQ